MGPFCEDQIIDSWRKNALAWTTVIRNREIDSRRLVTDQAVVDAIASCEPLSVLDIGCGEGWLARELAARGMRVTGVDAIPELVDIAKREGGGDFLTLSYAELAENKLGKTFDLAVANFSLLGKESVDKLFAKLPSLLNRGGHIVVQTLHPVIASNGSLYQDGWRDGSWAGFGNGFTDPAPWYFRTIESWVRLFRDCDLRLLEIREPLHPQTHKPASVIFITETD